MENRNDFQSKIGVVLAAAGAAVGLGNVWRFPTEVANHGGSAFLLIYIGCVIFLGMPVMLSEFLIGRRAKANTIDAYKKLAPKTGWVIQGYLGWFVAWVILCYYSVVAGWTLKYFVAGVCNQVMNQVDSKNYFIQFSSGSIEPVIYTIAFLLITHIIVVRGVQNGIERYSKLMMPLLFMMIVVLAICSLTTAGAQQGLEFLFRPDFSKVTSDVFLGALGQAFFSLSVGMGCLVTYGSYFSIDTSLTRTVASVVSIDTLVAILCGIIIFPAVFSATNQAPEAGPGLVFITLPQVFAHNFAHMHLLGFVFTIFFYLLLVLAALTSTIAIHESITAYIHENGKSRHCAAWITTSVCIVFGVLCTWSFGPLSDFKPFFGLTFFDFFDFLSAKIIMPIGGFIVCLFTGWYLDKKVVYNEITNNGTLKMPFFSVFIFILKFLAPVAIACIFMHELGWI